MSKALIVLLLLPLPAWADREVRATVEQARALIPDDDGIFSSEQDFYVKLQVNSGAVVYSNIEDSRDHAAWTGPLGGFTAAAAVPDGQRFVQVYGELWDSDPNVPSGDDLFDVNPGAPRVLFGKYDTCTMRFTLSSTGAVSNGASMVITGDSPDDPASLTFRVESDGPSTPNDVAIRRATPVQVVEDPAFVIEGKPTALLVELVSSFATDQTIALNGTLSDGNTTATDSRMVTVPAHSAATFLLFGARTSLTGTGIPLADGPNISLHPTFLPTKNATAALTWDVDIASTAEQPSANPNFPACWLINNAIEGERPIIRTRAPRTLYVPTGWSDEVYDPTAWADPTAITTVMSRTDVFLRDAYPLTTSDQTLSAVGVPLTWPTPMGIWPTKYILRSAGTAAMAAGFERAVLTVRPGWLGGRLELFGSGYSLAEWAPHAVFAEPTNSEVVAHELGHTYSLSQRGCDPLTSGRQFLESNFNAGCRDEYTHYTYLAGQPYIARGWDVAPDRAVRSFMTSNADSTVVPHPGDSRVQTVNLMGGGSEDISMGFTRWIDTFSFDILSEYLRDPQDPWLLNLSGSVYTLDPLAPGAVFEGSLDPHFQFMGFPDAAAENGATVGGGWFAARVVTGSGTQTYRFNPLIGDDGEGSFSFSVPMPQDLLRVDLLGPSDVGHEATNADTLLDARVVTTHLPAIHSLQALIPGSMGATGTLTPGQSVTLKWTASDGDGDNLTAIVLVDAPDGQPESVPVSLPFTGDHVTLPHALFRLAGSYGASVIISDGVRSQRLDVADLFDVCLPTAEITDGLDNDCDGAVDEHLTHDVCTWGSPLSPAHSPCADDICAVDPYCCNTWWDGLCVDEVSSVCEASCL